MIIVKNGEVVGPLSAIPHLPRCVRVCARTQPPGFHCAPRMKDLIVRPETMTLEVTKDFCVSIKRSNKIR